MKARFTGATAEKCVDSSSSVTVKGMPLTKTEGVCFFDGILVTSYTFEAAQLPPHPHTISEAWAANYVKSAVQSKYYSTIFVLLYSLHFNVIQNTLFLAKVVSCQTDTREQWVKEL